MDSIFSLTVKLIEHVFSSKTLRSDLDALNGALRERDFAKAIAASKRLISESKIEITDARTAEAFVTEATFALALSEYLCGNLQAAEDDLIKCLKNEKFKGYSYLLLSVVHEKQGAFDEALATINSARKIFPGYYYFCVAELRILIATQRYEKAAKAARALVVDIGSRGDDISLLPPFSTEAIDRAAVGPVVEGIFLHSDFTFELLFLSAEAHFNFESYDEAFEYYKEASASARPGEGKAECLYKMACCKIRLNDFTTARELLESLIDAAPAAKGAEKYRQGALLDLAGLHEYSFADTGAAAEVYVKYCEACGYSDLDILARTGRLLFENGRYNEALFHLCKIGDEAPDGFEGLDHLIGSCYFETGRHELAAAHLEKAVSHGHGEAESVDARSFRSSILLAENYIVLGKFREAGAVLTRLGGMKLSGIQKIEHASLRNFFENYRECVNVIILTPVFYKASETPKAISFNVTVHRGFVRTDSFSESDVGAIVVRLSELLQNCVVIVGANTPQECSLEISSAFREAPVIYERFLRSFQRDNLDITVTENPLKYGSIEPPLKPLVFIIHILNAVPQSTLPDLFAGPWPEPDRKNPCETRKSSFLKFYDFFRKQRGRFSLITTFCKITIKGDAIFPGSDDRAAGESEKNRLWPYMINFKNIELPPGIDSESFRFLVHGCDEIFLYNYLRECRERLDGRETVHIVTPPSKAVAVGELLSFILKKLEYSNSGIKVHGNVAESVCLKKVRSITASKVKSVTASFDALAAILTMQAGYRRVNEIDNALEDFVAEKVGFSHFSCDYERCPDFGRCCVSDIFSSYDPDFSGGGGDKRHFFHVSPAANYLALWGGGEGNGVFSPAENLIFLDLPGFCSEADSFFSETVEMGRLASELAAPIHEMPAEAVEKIRRAAERAVECCPAGLKWFECRSELSALLRASHEALSKVDAGLLEGYTEFAKLKTLSDYHSRHQLADLFSFGTENTCDGILFKFELSGWTESMSFGSGARRVFIIDPEDPGQYFYSRLSRSLKFFKTYDATKRSGGQGKPARILFLRDDSQLLIPAVKKFAAAGKKTGIFRLDYRVKAEKESGCDWLPEDSIDVCVKTPTELEPEIVGLDCVAVDLNYISAERALAMVSILKNTVSKYGCDIVWIVVSTPVSDACFSSRPGAFSTMEGLSAFSNELEFADSFTEKPEIRRLISEISTQAAAYEAGEAHADFGSGRLSINPNELVFANKCWNRISHQLAQGAVRNVVAEDMKMLEFMVTSLCFFSSREKKHRAIFLYCENEGDAGRLKKTLAACGVACGTLKSREEQDHVVILSGRRIDSLVQQFKNTRSPEFMLLTYNCVRLKQASLGFSAAMNSGISKLASTFGSALHALALRPAEWLRFRDPDDNFSTSITGALFAKISERRQPVNAVLRTKAASIDEAAARIAEKTAAECGTHLICSGEETLAALRAFLSARARSAPNTDVIYSSFEEGPGTMAAVVEKAGAGGQNVLVHVVATKAARFDSAAFGGRLTAFGGLRNVSVHEVLVEPHSIDGADSSPGYHEVRIFDFYFLDRAGENVLFDAEFAGMINPVSFFSESRAERSLAILSENGGLSLGPVAGAERPSAGFGQVKIAEMIRSGVIELLRPDVLKSGGGARNDLDPYALAEEGSIRILKSDEFFDRFTAERPDANLFYFSEPHPLREYSQKLKKLDALRKRFVQELYDLEGFSTGKWIGLPFADADELTYNDYVFIREICTLTWFSVCEFKRQADGSPAIRHVYRSGNIDYKLERLSVHLGETLEAVASLFDDGRLPGPACPADVIGAILSTRANYEKLQKGEFTPSYIMKLLRLLSLYGFVNFCAHSLPSRPLFAVSVAKGYSLIDRPSFSRISKNLAKYDL